MRQSSFLASVLALSTVFAACDDDDGDEVLTPDSGKPDASLDGAALRNDAGIDATVTDAGPQARDLTLRFKAKFGQQDLVCGQDYAGQGSTKISVTPKDLRFYVEQISLLTKQGDTVGVSITQDGAGNYQANNVALLDFTTTGGDCSGGPTTSNTSLNIKVPAKEYAGLRLTIGIPESLNHTDPTTAPLPLQAPGAAWDWTNGYRFFIAELTPSEDADAGAAHTMDAGAGDAGSVHGGQAGLGFVHVGSTGCTKNGDQYACLNQNRAHIELANFDPEKNEIVVDMGALFSTADLSGNVQCHGMGASCAPMFEALGINLADGGVLSTQRVFRVE